MPLVPPWTSSTSPGCSAPTPKTLDHTVHTTSGSAAASSTDSPAGTGSS